MLIITACTLFNLTKKDVGWHWGESEQASFNKLKELITSTPILVFPDDSLPYHVKADSSDTPTGAVLSQQSLEDSGKWHPIAFFSKSLSPVEWNYEIHDKEMLAIIWALEEWWHFLEGTPHQFKIWTDHKNLEYFCMSKKLNRQQAWWSLHLSQFDFTLHHRPGSSMGKSEALSQCSDHRSRDNANITLLRPSLFTIQVLEGVTVIRVEAELLRDIQREFWHGEKEESVVKAVEELQKGHLKLVRVVEWSERDGLLHFWGRSMFWEVWSSDAGLCPNTRTPE